MEYRPNVAILLVREDDKILVCERLKVKGAWQFPQGGVNRNESLIDAMYRELQEETGLQKQHVRLVAHTKDWLRYELPRRLLRNQRRGPHGPRSRKRVNFKGQKQVWFLY